jgi:hypothetical protein
MCHATDNPVSCEIRDLVHLIYGNNMSSSESTVNSAHALYGRNVTSEGTVRQWCSEMGERTNVDGGERSSRPVICNE